MDQDDERRRSVVLDAGEEFPLTIRIDDGTALQLDGGALQGLAMIIDDGAGDNKLSARAVAAIIDSQAGERPLEVAGSVSGIGDVHHGIDVSLKVDGGVMNAEGDLHGGGLSKAFATDGKEKHGMIEADADSVAVIGATESVGSLTLHLVYDSGEGPAAETLLKDVDKQEAVIGLIDVGAQGGGTEAQAGTGGSAGGFQSPVLTVEHGSLESDAAKGCERAEAVGGEVAGEKIVVVGGGEKEGA